MSISAVKIGLGLIATAFVIYHILILPFSPLPWFDETYFASMTLHWGRTGEFLPEIGPLLEYYYPQAKAYGPGYFIIMNLVFNLFGFGITQMRLPGLLFGIVFILIAERILKYQKFNRIHRFLFVALLSFDPIFLQNIHSGRMDSMALMLAGFGIFFLLKFLKTKQIIDAAITGILFGSALLTTPRIAVTLAGPGVVLIYYLVSPFSWRNFILIGLIGLLMVGVYSLWVYYGFGGPAQMWEYFWGQPKEALRFKSMASGYLSNRIYIPKYQIPLIATVLLLYFYLAAKRKLYFTPLHWIAIVNIIVFYKLVNDTGIYSALVVPFWYLLLVLSIPAFNGSNVLVNIRLSALFVGFNIVLFLFKNLFILNSIPQRNFNSLNQIVNKLIPPKSKVIGDESYYYSVLQSGSEFQYMDRGADGYKRKKYHENVFNYKYMIVKLPISNPGQYNWYVKDRKLKTVGKIEMPPPYFDMSKFTQYFKWFGISLNNGYNGIVLER